MIVATVNIEKIIAIKRIPAYKVKYLSSEQLKELTPEQLKELTPQQLINLPIEKLINTLKLMEKEKRKKILDEISNF